MDRRDYQISRLWEEVETLKAKLDRLGDALDYAWNETMEEWEKYQESGEVKHT